MNTIQSKRRVSQDFFDFRNTQYEKVLYLDTDILVIKDIQPIFKIAQADVLYALEEGTVGPEMHGWDYWGTLFQEDGTLEKYHKKTAFNSGVLLFRNCETIRLLFLQIKHTIPTS
jgi:lipopolysaccharide biosynthesis glycosyltransferase